MSGMGKQRVSTVKVGLLTLISLGLLIFSLIWLRGRGWSAGQAPFEVYFTDVNGLREGAAVQMMGIRVGFVERIEPLIKDRRYFVRLLFTVNNPDVVKNGIPKGSSLSIEQSGIIGEQFVEITPPPLREITLTTFKKPAKPIKKGIPVRFLYQSGYEAVGEIEKVESVEDGNLVRHRLYYRITMPGAEMPRDPLFELTLDKNGEYYLRILPREPIVAQKPDSHLQFTIENPMRMKRFLEIQMESAEALKLTNEKINQLLSDDTIESLTSTLKNTEVLTARANDVLESANVLFQTTQQDLDRLATVSEALAGNVDSVTHNINSIIGDPKLKGEMTSTVAALRESSNAMRDLLSDPALKQTVLLTRDTSQNAAELVSTLKRTVEENQIPERMDRIVTRLDTSLGKLDSVLTDVNELTSDQDQTLKGTLTDLRETSRNLRKLSNKFSGRFTLFKLLF